MNQRKLSLLLLLTMCMASQCSLAATISYETSLSGLAESPPNASPGTGFSTIEYDPLAHLLSLDVTFSDLLGTTTAAHIHCCTLPPGNAGVATPLPTFPGFPLGVTSGSYSIVLDLMELTSWNPSFVSANGGTAAGAEVAFTAGLDQGKAYFNIHTTAFPGGEIRGFYERASVPEPATVALFGIGLLALLGIGTMRRLA